MKPLEIIALSLGAYGAHRYLQGTPLSPKELAQRWIDTLARRNPEEITKLYAMDGILIPTFGKIKCGRAAITEYFERFMEFHGLQGKYNSMIVQEYISNRVNGCIVSGTYTFQFVSEEGPQTVDARYSFVFNSEGLILNHHSSGLPDM